jgi:hypothetical protein
MSSDEFDQRRTLFASALIEDMTIRNLSQATQQSYINSVINRQTGSASGTCARLLHLIA